MIQKCVNTPYDVLSLTVYSNRAVSSSVMRNSDLPVPNVLIVFSSAAECDAVSGKRLASNPSNVNVRTPVAMTRRFFWHACKAGQDMWTPVRLTLYLVP